MFLERNKLTFIQKYLSAICILGSIVMMITGQCILTIFNAPVPSVFFFILAFVLFFVNPKRLQYFSDVFSSFQPSHSGKLNRWGIILLSLAILFGGLAFWLFAARKGTVIFPWSLHILSILLLFPAVFLIDGIRGNPDEITNKDKWKPIYIIIFAVIIIIGTVLRIYRLDQIPFGTWYDEADYGLNAMKILNEPGYLPVYVESTQLPGHFIFLIALIFKIIGTSTFSIRMVSVLFGIGTIGAAFLAGQELFDKKYGLVFAFLLAVSRWDINWSRIGMHGVTVPFFELLVIGFLIRALKRQHYIDYLLAGLSVGLGFCFYFSFRLFPIVIGLFIIAVWLNRRDIFF